MIEVLHVIIKLVRYWSMFNTKQVTHTLCSLVFLLQLRSVEERGVSKQYTRSRRLLRLV